MSLDIFHISWVMLIEAERISGPHEVSLQGPLSDSKER